MWNYVVTAHKPTSVHHVVTGNFTSPVDHNVIIARSTRLEIHLMTPEGLQPMLDVGLYGRISTLALYRPQGETQDLLFISTERYKMCVLGYNPETKELVTRANGDIQDRVGRATDNGHIGTIDPDCRMIGLHLYDGLFKVIPIEVGGNLKEAFNIRLEELQVVDICFLYGCEKPTIAVLHQGTKGSVQLKTHSILVREKEIEKVEVLSQKNLEQGSSMLIPVPKPACGVIVVGERSISYLGASGPITIAMPECEIETYGRIDPDGSRFLLGEAMGKLYILVVEQGTGDNGQVQVTGLKLQPLGEINCPSCLTYLDNGVVFVGSNYGDSQLIKLNSEAAPGESHVQVLETYLNLGPIVDFTVVDLERQGQDQIVTCSGAYKDGSLRVIRNGIGINEQAAIELPGIKGMWNVREGTDVGFDRYLVQSFIGETRILGIDGEEMGEAELAGIDYESQTLWCGNVVDNCVVQVTEKSVRICECGTWNLLDEWKPPPDYKINVAAANQTQVLVATSGGKLVYIEISERKFVEKHHTTLDKEIACLNIDPIDPASNSSPVCAVGMWEDITVRVLKVPSLEEITREELGGEIIPRSVLFVTLEGKTYLLCALGDGHLFNLIYEHSLGQLQSKKKISIGTQPISLSKFVSKGQTNVFAASDRSTVIYSRNGKILYSNVNLKEVNYMCPFNAENFPDCLAISSETSLAIGTIDEIQKLHIRTIPLGEQPRRLAHQESSQTFAVGTIANGAEDEEKHMVRLLDDQIFETQFVYNLDNNEQLCSLASMTFEDDENHYYVVGTAYVVPEESDPSTGRILVFAVKDNALELVTTKETKGAVYNLNSFNGKLLAGVNSKIQLFKWSVSEDNSKELTVECGHHGHIIALWVAVRGDFILVGDLMKSVTVLMYKPLESSIVEIARDYGANWMTSVAFLDDDIFLGAENSYNLFTLRKNGDAATDEERARLEIVGEYHLGEFVNAFRKGSLVMRAPEGEANQIQTTIYGTISGAVGIVAQLPKEQFDFFSDMQKAMTKVVKGVGGFNHAQWRQFSSDRKTTEAKGFIDGDLIESFWDLSRDKMTEVCDNMTADVTVDQLSRRVEDVSRIH